ncbi:hypothetical protein MASR2M117_25550 [Paludibacter sp.]
MTRPTNILLILLLAFFNNLLVSAQTAEGGGVYIKNNGKLINSIVTENYAVSGFGISGSSGDVINCTVNSNYYLKTAVIYPGDLYLDDGVVFTPKYDNNGNLIFPSGYNTSNVIGICFWSNTNNDFINGRSWFVSLNEVSIPWSPNGMTNGVGYNPIDIPNLYNFTNAEAALMDYDGKGNTKLIVDEPGFIQNPTQSYALTTSNCAAKYSYEYRKQVGEEAKWFLPSIGQLRRLETELSLVNAILTKLGKTTISGEYWSSNEYSRQLAWTYNFPTTAKQPANMRKSNSYKVRPISIIFQKQ